jgi:hypothetical protein
MKTALAPTADLATAKVEKFVKTKLLPAFGSFAKLDRFYLCEPGTSDVSNRQGEKWVEANFGAHIICDSFSTDDLYDIRKLSETISVNEASVHGADNHKIEVNVWLSARVMR